MDFCLIFVPFGHCDEPEILPYENASACPIGADVRQVCLQVLRYQLGADRPLASLPPRRSAKESGFGVGRTGGWPRLGGGGDDGAPFLMSRDPAPLVLPLFCSVGDLFLEHRAGRATLYSSQIGKLQPSKSHEDQQSSPFPGLTLSLAGHIVGAGSAKSTTAAARRSPPRACAGSPSSTPSRPRSAAARPSAGSPNDRRGPRLWSRPSATGSGSSVPASRPSPASVRSSPISAATGTGSGSSSPTAASRWTAMLSRISSGRLPLPERMRCSPATTKARSPGAGSLHSPRPPG